MKKEFINIDIAKWVISCFIILLHLPFNNSIIHFIQQYISRLGVPLFFSFSGFFCYMNAKQRNWNTVAKKCIFRIGKLYLLWGGLYFILMVYNRGIQSYSSLIKEYILCAPAYLWYLPAVLLGCISMLSFSQSKKKLYIYTLISLVLYFVGTLGNSYNTIFRFAFLQEYLDVFLTTRNGVFFAPLFVAIGAICYEYLDQINSFNRVNMRIWVMISYLFFCIEVFVVKSMIPAYEDSSMYFTLPYITVGILCYILDLQSSKIPSCIIESGKEFRKASTLIYCAQYGIAYMLRDYNAYVIFFITIAIGTFIPFVNKFFMRIFKKYIDVS